MFRCSRQEYSEVLEDLCRHLSLNGRVESTQISYSRAVRDMMEDVGKVPLACSEQEVIRHLASCRDSHNLSSSALNSRISGIKYLYREVYRRLDIIVDLPNPRRARLQGDILTVEEVKRLFDGTRSIKHLAVLHLLYDTGLRAHEVAALRVCDFDGKRGVLTVRHGKGDKARVVPYGQQTRETLNEYFRQERPLDALFVGSTTGEAFTVRGVQYVVNQALKRCGLRKRVHPHTLRHTFAVHYLNNGGSLMRLQQLLGHAHLSTTLVYLKYASVPLREVETPLDFLTGKRRT
ncbi:MAG TPA: tyrosine-type recombinase/integrase [Nitrospira sp.]|nr:tyrosine-type recombinase/integrase [Nitrospira sp.]